MSYDKDYLRSLMAQQKQETLVKNAKLLDEFREDFIKNNSIECDFIKDPITIQFCETQYDKRRWAAYLHLSSSLPYRGFVGRRIQLFVKCGEHIAGMIQLASPLAQNPPRDKHIGFKSAKEKWANINDYYNVCACVSTPKYAPLLTGKLLVYCIFSREIQEYLVSRYKGLCLGFEITSLYGKSSIYNRIPFVDYLGTTDGYSAVSISDDDWKKALQEWKDKCPHHKKAGGEETSRLAEAKFQVLEKLKGWYRQNKLPFPYIYKREENKKGVYFGFMKEPPPMAVRVEDWRERWLKMRLAGGFKAREDL